MYKFFFVLKYVKNYRTMYIYVCTSYLNTDAKLFGKIVNK